MKRLFSWLLVLLMLLSPSALADKTSAGQLAFERAQALPEDQREVNVFTWTYYIPDEVIAEFEQASGIRVNFASMMGNEDVLPKLTTGGEYDLVVCSDYIISDLAAMDLLTPLDTARLSNHGNIDPVFQSQYFDPDNRFTVPYTITVPLIVYDPNQVDFEPTGYKDLWRPEFEGNLATVAEWRGVIALAQKKLGYSLNDTDEEHMNQVGEELLKLKPNIAVMNDDTPHNALIYGDAIAGYMYGSQIVAAREMMPDLKVVYPEEGIYFGVDAITIPKSAPHPDAAYIFLDYLLDGEVSAYASQLINYGGCNTAARAFMPAEFLQNDSINPPTEAVEQGEMMMPLDGSTMEKYNKIWTEFMK